MPLALIQKAALRLIAALVIIAAAGVMMPVPEALAALQGSGQRRNRPSRRITNPVRPQPAATAPIPRSSPGEQNPTDPVVVSTAEENSVAAEDNQMPGTRAATGARRRAASSSRGRAAAESDPEELRRTVSRLTAQLTKLSEEFNQLKEQQGMLVDLERLTRAEQRAESLRTQLREVIDKEFMLQERAAQIEDELQPESIERRALMVGTLRPTEVRDQIRRGLERERERVRAQLDLLATSRTRLEIAVTNADREVERLRNRIDADEQAQSERRSTTTTTTPSTVNTQEPDEEGALPTSTSPRSEPPRE